MQVSQAVRSPTTADRQVVTMVIKLSQTAYFWLSMLTKYCLILSQQISMKVSGLWRLVGPMAASLSLNPDPVFIEQVCFNTLYLGAKYLAIKTQYTLNKCLRYVFTTLSLRPGVHSGPGI